MAEATPAATAPSSRHVLVAGVVQNMHTAADVGKLRLCSFAVALLLLLLVPVVLPVLFAASACGVYVFAVKVVTTTALYTWSRAKAAHTAATCNCQ